MPRYVVEERSRRVGDPRHPGRAEACLRSSAVTPTRASPGFTRMSATTEQDVLRLRRAESGGDPEDRRRNELPVDRITQVRVLDPFFYH